MSAVFDEPPRSRPRQGVPMNAWPKRCSCGVSYSAVEWTSLSFVGYQEDGADGRIELRNCDRCNSTIAVDVEPSGLPWTIAGDLVAMLRTDAIHVDVEPDYPFRRRLSTPESKAEAERLSAMADDLERRTRSTMPAPAASIVIHDALDAFQLSLTSTPSTVVPAVTAHEGLRR